MHRKSNPFLSHTYVHNLILGITLSVYLLIHKWLQTPCGNGESPNGNSFVFLPISIWGSPFENRDPNGNVFLFVFSPSIPKWSRTRYGNGLVTGQSPYGNGDASIPLSIQGSPRGNGLPYLFIRHMETMINHFQMGMCQIPVSKWETLYGSREPKGQIRLLQ